MPTWIILDDDEDIPVMLSLMFQSLGVDARAFRRGEELLTWAEEIANSGQPEQIPELALIDIRLTGLLSGIDAAARLRRLPELENIAIVLMTAYRLNSADEQRVMSLSGADALLVKPLPRKDDLFKTLKDVVRSRIIENGTT